MLITLIRNYRITNEILKLFGADEIKSAKNSFEISTLGISFKVTREFLNPLPENKNTYTVVLKNNAVLDIAPAEYKYSGQPARLLFKKLQEKTRQ